MCLFQTWMKKKKASTQRLQLPTKKRTFLRYMKDLCVFWFLAQKKSLTLSNNYLALENTSRTLAPVLLSRISVTPRVPPTRSKYYKSVNESAGKDGYSWQKPESGAPVRVHNFKWIYIVNIFSYSLSFKKIFPCPALIRELVPSHNITCYATFGW